MKQVYTFIVSLLLIPLLGNAENGKLTPENTPPCTAEILTMSQEICDNIFPLAAMPPEPGETGAWTGPGGTAVVSPSSSMTFITNLNPGLNEITWTIFDASGTPCSSTSITIINSQVQTTPAITTLNNQEVCDEDGFQLSANQSLLPGEVGTWSSGNGLVTFSPSANDPNAVANNLQAGNNNILWMITNGVCSAEASLTVVNNEVTTVAEIEGGATQVESCVSNGFFGVLANITNQLAPGETGTWTGPPGVTFTPNAEAPFISGLGPGANVITWTITRGGCPPSSVSLTITNNEPMNVNINTAPGTATCADGSLTLDADPPTANQTGVWTGPAGTIYDPNDMSAVVTVTNVPVGPQTFTWTITQGGCTESQDVTIEIYDEPVIDSVSVTDVTTVGGTDGVLTICVNGGTAPYQYDWTPAQGSGMPVSGPCDGNYEISGLQMGMYVITVTDGNGCVDVFGDMPGDSIIINDPDCSDFDIGLVVSTNESCDESDNGSITIEVLNAQGDILYSIGNGIPDVTTSVNPYTFENLPEGSYNVTVSDERLCTDSYIANPVVITAPDPLTATTAPTAVTTVNGSDGTIGVCIEGGTGPYTVVWSPVNAGTVGPDSGTCTDNQIVTGLVEDEYDVTVTDANGCEVAVNNIMVSAPVCDDLQFDTVTSTNASCNGADDGSITIMAVSDDAPIVYSIDGGVTYVSSNVFDNLPPGTYDVFIQDAQQCVLGPTTIIITEPDVLDVTPTVVNVTTVGGSDGQILLCVEGGTSPYTFEWDPMPAGSTVGTNTDPGCNGEAWSIIGLPADMYTVTITDANDCIEILGDMSEPGDTITIVEPDCTYLTDILTMNNSCGVNPSNPSYDGSIEITVIGSPLPPPPYTYELISTDPDCTMLPSVTIASTSYTFTGLSPCNYSVQVTAGDGCGFGFATVNITEPVILSAPPTVSSPTTVSGTDGEICVEPMGGTPPYTVMICGQIAQPGGACNGFFVGGFAAGESCNVVVQDANLCESTGTVIVDSLDCSDFIVSLTSATGSCAEAPSGILDLTVTGGQFPYTFEWSNGADTEDLIDVVAGTYTVTITDDRECTVVISDGLEIEQYEAIEAEASADVIMELGDPAVQLGVTTNANATVSSVTWSPPTWLDDPNIPNPTVDPTDADSITYTVTVTTTDGCVDTDQVTVLVEDNSIVVVPGGFTPGGNGPGENDYFYPVIDGNVDVISLTVWNRWGERIYDNPNPPGWDGLYKNTKQPLGTYVYVLEYQVGSQDPAVLHGDFVLIR